jgi:hypothetical protein
MIFAGTSPRGRCACGIRSASGVAQVCTTRSARKSAMRSHLRPTGIAVLGDVPWGTHACLFFETKQDLLDVLVPYFNAGLSAGESCVWLVSEPLTIDEARSSLSAGNGATLDDYIEIIDATDWYGNGREIDAPRLLNRWNERLARALSEQREGLRVSGTAASLKSFEASGFSEYERAMNSDLQGKKMIALCTYPLSGRSALDVYNIVDAHQSSVARRRGQWEVLARRDDFGDASTGASPAVAR